MSVWTDFWDQYSGTGGAPTSLFGQAGKMAGDYDPVAAALRSGTGNVGDRAGQALGFTGPTTGPLAASGYNNVANKTTGVDTTAQDQTKAVQDQLLAQLQEQANGTGPSRVQQQLKDATDRNIQSVMAVQAADRSGNPGLAALNAANTVGAAQQQAAGQGAQASLEEQLQARGLLGQVAGGVRGQDLNLAGMQAQNNQFNTGAQNTFQSQQNQAIADAEAARQRANLQSRNDAMNQLYSFMGKLPGGFASMGSSGAAAGAGA